ncbi:glycoside hydrolase family 28 protein [Planosporangium sp. 12N6]|uniref:glycoside hydrolase family 28 protein n=1 Tax=Planosporangium spinosum TaxID=3402278 RepID=UPI003CF693C2
MRSRRDFLRLTGTVGAGITATQLAAELDAQASPAGPGHPPATPDHAWLRAGYIKARVRRPYFPNRYFDITRFGAVGDGVTDCTEAIRRAVRTCHDAGGGHVLVPTGDFLTGPIHLLSHVDLHLTDKARLRFSTDPGRYLPAVLTRFEGVELYNYSPLVYALDQENIAVTGTGILDGQADNQHWWPWKGNAAYGWKPGDPNQNDARARLLAMAEQGVPVEQRVFGDGGYLRSSFIQPYRCRNVLVEGVTIVNSPMWEIHPTLCENVLVQDVTVNSHGPNNDGCDPESCRLVVIRGCTFDTGDDCIAIKSGRNADGRRVNVPSEDLLIENCQMRDGHGGVTLGSEMSGGIRNVFVRNCHMSSPNLDIALRFKTNSVRGGFITGFHARDIVVGVVGKAVIDVNFYYEEGPGHGFNPVVSDLNVSNLIVESAAQGLNLRGYADDHIDRVTLRDVNFGTTTAPDVVEYVDHLVFDNVVENGAPLPSPAPAA